MVYKNNEPAVETFSRLHYPCHFALHLDVHYCGSAGYSQTAR
jgi:hypothetical protein